MLDTSKEPQKSSIVNIYWESHIIKIKNFSWKQILSTQNLQTVHVEPIIQKGKKKSES